MTSLPDALDGISRLGLDTSPVIYFVEVHPRYDALVTPIFQRIADGNLAGVTSVITLMEVLVHPISQGQVNLVQDYADLLLHNANFSVIPIDAAVAQRVAHLRAHYRLRTPDALQIAVALEAGCQAFLTNDSALQRVAELRVLVLEQLVL